jgi:hypothetical protein
MHPVASNPNSIVGSFFKEQVTIGSFDEKVKLISYLLLGELIAEHRVYKSLKTTSTSELRHSKMIILQ